MTNETTKSPKEGEGKATQKHGSSCFETRVIGVEVICGPVKETFVYTTDNLVPAGSNITIEVIRQAQYDLAKLLADRGLVYPKRQHFQFDNGSENKTQVVFGYISMLVESGLLEDVTANFLIVGHTHTSIDQFFSVLSKKITKQKFIATPLSMAYLLKHAHSVTTERPQIFRRIKVITLH